MILDYNPANQLYTLRVDLRTDPYTVEQIKEEYGLDFYPAASSLQTAMFATPTPYAAATFGDFATPLARDTLGWIFREIEASRKPASDRHFDIPRSVREEGKDLWPYQKADLEYMLSREAVLDADEPGLGKTATAIGYANETQAQRVLVICPASIRFQWIGAWQYWSTMGETYTVPDYTMYAVTSGKRGVNPKAALTVVSYDLARHPEIYKALRQTDYDLLIADEVHFAKSPSARRSRALFGGGSDPLYVEGLCSKAKRVVALSGTPLPNRPREIYTLGRHCDHGALDYLSEDRFYERFNPIEYREVVKREPIELPGGTIEWRETTVRVPDERSGRHAELQNRLRAHFMTRHLKREVQTQLKYPVYNIVRAEETTAVKAALRAEKMLDFDPDTFEGAHAKVDGHIAEARRVMGEALAPQAAAYAETLLIGGVEKLVIFYWHISVGAILAEALAEYGVARIDGRTSPTMKEALKQRFITDPTCQIMMGNVLSLGTGTDGLQLVCGHALVAEPDWAPANNQQCIDRIDRGGQTRTVQADFMVAPGSIGERVLASSLRKLRVTDAALDKRIVV